MPENPTSMPEPSGENTAEVVAGKNDSNVPETPAEPLGGVLFIRETMILRGSLCRPSLHRAEDLFIPEMTISLESRRHRSRRLADAPSIPTIRSGTRAFRRFLFRSHTRRSQEGITTAESGFKCQHIRPYFGCLYRWPEYLLRFRVCHDLFLYPRDGRIPHRHCAQDQRSDLLSADDCLCVR